MNFLRRLLVFIITSGALTSVGIVAFQFPARADVLPVFADEFDGTGTPDITKWGAQIGAGWDNGKNAAYYTPFDRAGSPNAYQDGIGDLVIEARREAYSGTSFTSARMASRFNQSYGRLEVRARFDALQQGVWPALWTVGSSGTSETQWPNTGEIDLMEWFGGNPPGPEVISHMHSRPDPKLSFKAAGSDVREWNTYSVEWRPGFVEFKLNGIQYGYLAAKQYGPGYKSFKSPQGIRLNIALNDGLISWFPPMTSDFQIARLYVDYVRWYA